MDKKSQEMIFKKEGTNRRVDEQQENSVKNANSKWCSYITQEKPSGEIIKKYDLIASDFHDWEKFNTRAFLRWQIV